MRRAILVIASAIAGAALLVAPASATDTARVSPKVGMKCAAKGHQVTVAKQRLECVQRGGKLMWATVAPLPKASSRVTSTPDPLRGDITVLAAASLTEAFDAIAQQFQSLHPKVHVVLSYGASSALATQIVNGAPADVFASASVTNMQQVLAAGQAEAPTTFARNRMIIVTPAGNPKAIASVADLAKPGVKVALCQVQVPCGSVARQVFTNAGVSVTPVTYEADVKSVLTKVLLGEVDAGLVYVTDAKSAGDKVTAIAIPATVNAQTTYPIAVLKASASPTAAQAFVDFVLGDRGAAALAAVGFTVL